MAQNLELLAELERRGKLPEQYRAAFEEAKTRGLIPNQSTADMSFLGRLKDNVWGVEDGVTSFGENAAEFVNKFAESATLGLGGEEANAWTDDMLGISEGGLFDGLGRDEGRYDERLDLRRGRQEVFERDHKIANGTAEILSAFTPFGAGAKWASMGANGLSKAARGASVAGGSGALYGFMEGEGGVEDRLSKAASTGLMSAAFGAAAPKVINSVGNALSNASISRQMRQLAKNAPSTDSLKAHAQALYQKVDEAGLSINPSVFREFTEGLQGKLVNEGLDATKQGGVSLHPKSARVLEIISDGANTNSPLRLTDIERFRKLANTPASDFTNKADARFGTMLKGQIDDFVEGLSENDVMGDLPAVMQTLPKARELWGRASKSQTIDEIIGKSEGYLAGNASGIRNQISSMLKNPNRMRGYSDFEKDLMERILKGSFVSRTANSVGGGLGRLGAIGMGVATGGPVQGLVNAAASQGARTYADRSAIRNAEKLRSFIASGGVPERPQMNAALEMLLQEYLTKLAPRVSE